MKNEEARPGTEVIRIADGKVGIVFENITPPGLITIRFENGELVPDQEPKHYKKVILDK